MNKFIKMLAIVLSAMFLLTACAGNQGEDTTRTAVSQDGTAKDLEQVQINCWQKAIVDQLYDVMSKTTSDMYKKVTNGALAFMMVAFAIWFAFRLLSHVSSFVEENPAEVWTEIFRKALLCFTCGLIASSPGFLLQVLNLTVFPVYGAFLEFGSEILAKASEVVYSYKSEINVTVGGAATAVGTAVGAVAGGPVGAAVGAGAGSMAAGSTGLGEMKLFGTTIEWWNSGEPVICRVGAMDNATVDGFPEMPKNMMGCLICALNRRMNLGFSLAFEVMKGSGFTSTIVGLVILLSFTFVKLSFVFYLVDTIFKFTLMIVILPIMVMGFAFQYTRSWLGSGIKTILNSSAFMMFIAVIMAMAMRAIEVIIMSEEGQKIFNPESNVEMSFTEFSIPFMCLLLICFLIASSVGVAQQLSESLVGGSAKSNFNKKAQATLKLLVDGALALLTWGGSMAVQRSVKLAEMADKINKAKMKAQNKFNDITGRH